MPDIVTSWNNDYPTSYARDRKGILYMVNGMQRPKRWDTLTAAAEEAGITAPTAALTSSEVQADNGSGSVAAGTYYVAYRWLDDENIPSDLTPLYAVSPEPSGGSSHFDWTGLEAPVDTRIKFVELYRSTEGQQITLYLVAKMGVSGGITSIGNNGGNAQINFSEPHNLIAGSNITVAGTSLHNGDHKVTLVVTTTQVKTDVAFAGADTGGTWTIDGFLDTDTLADADLDDLAPLPILTSEGLVNARRFGLPPDFKSSIAFFQDRLFYAVDHKHTTGTITTAGNLTLVGVGSNWNTEMTGRMVAIDGETQAQEITVTGPTAASVPLATTTSTSGLAYTIYPKLATRNTLIYSESDEPESVPFDSDITWLNTVTIQDNTGDDDDVTGLMPYGAFLYILKDRHTYRLSYARQPVIDASVSLLANRGCINDNCWVRHERKAYLMDNLGIYAVNAYAPSGQTIEPIGLPIQDLWRDGTIDLTDASKKWYNASVDRVNDIIRFHVQYTGDGDTRPKRALCFHTRSQAWWTETYPWEIGGTCVMEIVGETRMLMGGESDVIYKTFEGTQDAGADIAFTYRTGTFELVEETRQNKREVRLNFEPVTAAGHVLNSRIYFDSGASPENFVRSYVDGSITFTKDSANAVIDMKVDQSVHDDISGHVKYEIGGRHSASHRAEKFISLELTGTQSATDNIVIHSVEVRGTR